MGHTRCICCPSSAICYHFPVLVKRGINESQPAPDLFFKEKIVFRAVKPGPKSRKSEGKKSRSVFCIPSIYSLSFPPFYICRWDTQIDKKARGEEECHQHPKLQSRAASVLGVAPAYVPASWMPRNPFGHQIPRRKKLMQSQLREKISVTDIPWPFVCPGSVTFGNTTNSTNTTDD